MRTIALELLCLFCRGHRLRVQHEEDLNSQELDFEMHAHGGSTVADRQTRHVRLPDSLKAFATLLSALESRAHRRKVSHRRTFVQNLNSLSNPLRRRPSLSHSSNDNSSSADDETRDFGESITDARTRTHQRRPDSSHNGPQLDEGESNAFEQFDSDNSGSRRTPDPPVPSSDEQSNSGSVNERSASKKLARFLPVRPLLDLDKTVQGVLKKEGVWRTTQMFGKKAIAQGVMDVKASPSIVWNQLQDLGSYPQKIVWVGSIDVYRRELQAAPEDLHDDVDSRPEQRKPPHIPFQLPRMPFQLPQLPQLPFQPPQFKLPQLPFQAPQLPPFFQSLRRPFMQQAEANMQEQPTSNNNNNTGIPGFGNTIETVSVKINSPIVPGIKVKSHMNFTFLPKKSSMLWTLDRSRINDFEEMEGHFHVAAHPNGSSSSRVFYEVGLVSPRWLPGALFRTIATRAITDCSSWVKTESELEAAPQPEDDIVQEDRQERRESAHHFAPHPF